jgi:hypothetical protein
MKKIFIFAAIIFSCSAFVVINTPEKDIVGKWKVDAASLPKAVEATINKMKETNPGQEDAIEEQRAALGLMISSLVYDYKADNSYEVTTPQGIQKGKWSIGNNGKQLQIERANGNKRMDEIIELSATRMILVNGDRKDTTLFIRP